MTRNQRAALLCAGLTVLLSTLPTAGARASTATFANGVATVTAAPGEANKVFIFGELDVEKEIGDEAGITAGAGCEQISATRVKCAPRDENGFTTYGHYDELRVDLGDGNDTFTTNEPGFALIVAGGAGDDELRGGFATAVTLDGGAGADTLRGTTGDDRITGGEDNDVIDGNDGSDMLDGGGGEDTIQGDGGLGANNGNDTIQARDGQRDTVSCDLGADTVVADQVDVVEAATCESVDRGAAPQEPDADDDGPSAACVKARRRVTAARRQLRRARNERNRAGIRKAKLKLKRAKRARANAC